MAPNHRLLTVSRDGAEEASPRDDVEAVLVLLRLDVGGLAGNGGVLHLKFGVWGGQGQGSDNIDLNMSHKHTSCKLLQSPAL